MLGSTYTVGKPGSLHVRKQYYDEYSYLSLGVLQAQTWPSTRVLYNFDKNYRRRQGISSSEKFIPNTECLR